MDEFVPRAQTAENREVEEEREGQSAQRDKVKTQVSLKIQVFENFGAKKKNHLFNLTSVHFENLFTALLDLVAGPV